MQGFLKQASNPAGSFKSPLWMTTTSQTSQMNPERIPKRIPKRWCTDRGQVLLLHSSISIFKNKHKTGWNGNLSTFASYLVLSRFSHFLRFVVLSPLVETQSGQVSVNYFFSVGLFLPQMTIFYVGKASGVYFSFFSLFLLFFFSKILLIYFLFFWRLLKLKTLFCLVSKFPWEFSE